jgi:hypothetical protein
MSGEAESAGGGPMVALQRILMNICEEDLHEAGQALNPIVADGHELRVCHHIITAAIYRPYSAHLLSSAAMSIATSLKDTFRGTLVSMLLERFNSRAYTPYRSALGHFLFRSIEAGLFSIPLLVETAEKFRSNSKHFEAILLNLYVWLAPELEQESRPYFDAAEQLIATLSTSMPNLYPTVQRFISDLPTLKAAEWSSLKCRRSGTAKIFSSFFRNNDIESLVRLSTHPAFKVNQRIAMSIYEPSLFVSQSPTLLEYAAFCGARDCFDFLLEHGADPDLADSNGRVLGEF